MREPNNMLLKLNLQNNSRTKKIPSKIEFRRWIKQVLTKSTQTTEITIRIVDAAESQALNKEYRHKNKPTNILSFPFVAPPGITTNILGDLVICAPIVKQEAIEQHKKITAHYAHLTIHGVLHLLGFEHDTAKHAKIMENLEIQYLEKLGFKNPY